MILNYFFSKHYFTQKKKIEILLIQNTVDTFQAKPPAQQFHPLLLPIPIPVLCPQTAFQLCPEMKLLK